jgi:hypothetical protein
MEENNDPLWVLNPEFKRPDFIRWLSEVSGFNALKDGVRAMFEKRRWILVQKDNRLEVFSLELQETVTEFEERWLKEIHNESGDLVTPNEATINLLALRLMASRDADESELTGSLLRLRRWLSEIPINPEITRTDFMDRLGQEDEREDGKK